MDMKSGKRVVIGLLGTTLDAVAAGKAKRWDLWRPSVDLCRHEDFLVHRFELLVQKDRFERQARLVADDIAAVSPETEVRIREVAIADPWDFAGVYGALLDFARAYPFDPDQEEYLVHITTGSHVSQICLFLLTESRYIPGKLLQTAPPRKYRSGEPGTFEIIDLDLSRYDAIAARFRREHVEAVSFLKSGIATRNRAFNRLIERIEEVALRSREPVLLTGPTGAGKSLLARRIHELKRARRLVEGPFVEVNSATLRGDQAMSALFGHVKGAFTGAARDRPGLLKAADRGILFLDEIGELGVDEQAMLLRAIEEKAFLPVGADAEDTSDFQLIAGTNRDLPAAVAEGRFREDLLARINLWTFRLPGLRDRPEDIEPNLDFELEECARRGGVRVTMSAEARALFLDFAASPEAAWTANFRDLSGAVRRMATLAPGGRITRAVADEEIERLREAWRGPRGGAGGDPLEGILGREALAGLDRFDRVQLADVVAVCRSCRSLSEAGRTLFAASRARKKAPNDADRLRKYLARFGLSWESLLERAPKS
jgi:transcriptional regulatory protein RtcR